jgi:hypothetical protein
VTRAASVDGACAFSVAAVVYNTAVKAETERVLNISAAQNYRLQQGLANNTQFLLTHGTEGG